ncbi:MAG: response regulator [Paludibacteraceae bacterium]|nr:response regulator [Paludibacteraceae bacterium]
MRKLVFILVLVCCCIPATAEFDVRHYSVEDGLSQNTIMSIIQDRDGYMWFGTWDGLNKFDGYRFTTYKSQPGTESFRNNRVEYIKEDSLGFIWFQTYDGKFHRFDKAREKFYTLSHSFPFIRYNAQRLFVEPAAGVLFLVADNGLLRIEEQTDGDIAEILYPCSADFHPNFVLGDSEGNIWYDCFNRIVRRSVFSADSVSFDIPSGEADTRITTAIHSSDGLWFGGTNGKIWRYSFTNHNFEPISLANNASVTSIEQLTQHELMVGTQTDGLYIYNSLIGTLQHIADGNQTGTIVSLTNDSYGVVWVENDRNGILRYRIADRSLRHLTQTADLRFAPLRANMLLLEDNEHNIWVNPFGGGFSRYNRKADLLENPLGGLTNMIHTAYVDRQGELWLSTYETGIDCLRKRKQQFRMHDMRHSNANIGEVRAMLQTADGRIVLADKDREIVTPNGKSVLKTIPHQIDLTVYCLNEDADGSLLVGTRHNGLYRLRNGILEEENTAADGSSLNNDAVYDILKTANGDTYVGTYGGGVNILHDGRWLNCSNGWSGYPVNECMRVRCLMSVGDSLILAGTTNGLLQIDIHNLSTRFTPYWDVRCMLHDSRGDIWLGTFSGGLNKVVALATDSLPAKFETYTIQNALRSDILLSMQEDAGGRIWFASESNITRFDPTSGIFQHFSPFVNAQYGYFTESKAIRLATGDIMFGYSNGYCIFSPERIIRSEHIPSLQLTAFQLFNNDVAVGAENSPLKYSISQTKEITLNHKQSVWSLEYAALDFFNAEKLEYAFILDGFDKDWNYVHNQRKATYTSLPPGKYVFRVRSTNAEGVWVQNERTLQIHILPSFWHTGWAYLIYILIALAVLAVIYMIVNRYNRLQQQVQVEQQVTDIRLRFFTNISHELRTPLTLISGPVDNILRTEKLSATARNQLEIVQSNANRMLRLINEILDFRKIQNKKMRLRIQQTSLSVLVEQTCSNFNKEAYDKHIDFRFENLAHNDIVWIDKEKTDIILYNLLSNAFKFTPAGKSITVSLSEKNNFVLLKVADQGVGIPREKRGILFERFSSHNEIENLAEKAGTGIGLNLVKELVDLHKGYIEVESETDKGTTFTVIFRKGKEHFGNEVDFVNNNNVLPHKQDPMQPKLDSVVIKQNLPHMLIVEDNQDMRTFMQNIFSNEFDIHSAKDGEEGLAIVQELGPDIVITDLMMPNMDGLELTNHIKSEEPTSHIPVILLTAKEAIESRLEAMYCGADDYITKPFSAQYLKARVNNILKQRQRLRDSYRSNLLTLQASPLTKEKTPDEVFLAKLLDFMEKNMDNNELVVEDMVSDMAMGRTVFFNKLKNLTGLSPVEFIREVRIKRAAQLLETGAYNVTEVTYMVGMNDSRYFSKCFKAVYGMTPTEYKKTQTEN